MLSFPELGDARETESSALMRQGANQRPSLRRWLLNQVHVPAVAHFIDTDVAPFVPFGWSVAEHRSSGLLRWDMDDVALWLSAQQQAGPVSGQALQAQLREQPVFNATVLDYLFDRPELIPPAWEDRFVFFWGTIYRSRTGFNVRALILKDGLLNCCARRIDQAWGPVAPAAIHRPR